MIKRHHHYVWRKYLQAWSENSLIWCYRNGKVFNPNIMGVGQAKDFYKLKKLTSHDINFIRSFTIGRHNNVLRETDEQWIMTFQEISEIREVYEKNGVSNEIIDIEVDKLIHNFEENYHCIIESKSIKYIEMILNKNISFFENDEGRADFSYYLCMQYIRTKKIEENIKSSFSSLEEKLGINIENAWSAMRYIDASHMALSLFSDRKFKIFLLDNKTSIPFITGDQPVLNTYAAKTFGSEIPDKTEFYYPLSPTIAILISKKNENDSALHLQVSQEDVVMYNSLIVAVSHEQIYANTRSMLDALMS